MKMSDMRRRIVGRISTEVNLSDRRASETATTQGVSPECSPDLNPTSRRAHIRKRPCSAPEGNRTHFAVADFAFGGRCGEGHPDANVPDRKPLCRTRRIFARLTAFKLSCPDCGAVDCVSFSQPWWKRKANFDPWRSRWRCRSCRHVFAVGLAIWPVRKAGNRPRESRPVDTIPTKQELIGLRLAVGQNL